MENETAKNYEKEFEQRFKWRQAVQVERLKELSEIAQSGGADSIKAFPSLWSFNDRDDPKEALRRSILDLWCEATECYIFGEFQSCILTCGAIVERCLKLEYQITIGPLPVVGKPWTLGVCIEKCGRVVSTQVLDLAKSIVKPRNDRVHANLEQADPSLAIMGGKERGIRILSPSRYTIEPFRGEARNVITITHKILKELYGVL